MSRYTKPDVQIVVTIPRDCDKDAVKAVRAACDGVLKAMEASEYQHEDRSGFHGYTAHHYTRTVRFEIEPPEEPALPAPPSPTEEP